jgi:hypothetical protein
VSYSTATAVIAELGFDLHTVERFDKMLTTPEIASEPSAADAPPVTISMRSTLRLGIELKSTLPPSFAGT